jgi:hypothetical protein
MVSFVRRRDAERFVRAKLNMGENADWQIGVSYRCM